MRYAIVTFGCRVNQADSLRLDEDLRSRGAVDGSTLDADLVVVNSCSVTASADQGTRQTIRRIARDNPSARIVVTGCYATRCASDVAALPNVVRIVDNAAKDTLVRDLWSSADSAAGELTSAGRYGDGGGPCGAAIAPGAAGRTAFTLRVQTGCEERCAYCIIPTTRGASRSTPIAEVVREVARISAAGYREIAITGVHLGSYGRELQPATSLLDLLRALVKVPGDAVLRVSSLEPMDCSDEIVDLVAASDGRLAPHFHLPLQHASDRMLARMRRPYTLDRYRRTVDRIIASMPHASIGSDVIVGFPGETDGDFEANVAYLSSSPLSHLHVFPYSDRPGTEASGFGDRVDGVKVRERGARVRDIGATLTRRFRDAQVGTIRQGLTIDDGTTVLTDNYLKVKIGAGLTRNRRVRVRVTESGGTLGGVVEPSGADECGELLAGRFGA